MRVECERCGLVSEYDAERYDYEPFQCKCGHINHVLDWEE
jgi:lysyl-tRNA synthetase class I